MDAKDGIFELLIKTPFLFTYTGFKAYICIGTMHRTIYFKLVFLFVSFLFTVFILVYHRTFACAYHALSTAVHALKSQV